MNLTAILTVLIIQAPHATPDLHAKHRSELPETHWFEYEYDPEPAKPCKFDGAIPNC